MPGRQILRISVPYEEPINPQLVIDTASHAVDKSARLILDYIEDAVGSCPCPGSKPFRTRESAITLTGTAQRTKVNAERFTQTELLRLKSNHAEPNQLCDGAGERDWHLAPLDHSRGASI